MIRARSRSTGGQHGALICPVCRRYVALRADMQTTVPHGPRSARCPGTRPSGTAQARRAIETVLSERGSTLDGPVVVARDLLSSAQICRGCGLRDMAAAMIAHADEMTGPATVDDVVAALSLLAPEAE